MTELSANAQLVSAIFQEVAKGNGAPFWEACHDDVVWRTIPTRLIDGGDVVALQAKGRNLTRDGQRYDNDYVFVIHFRDGKIARYAEYCDTELIARVLPDRMSAKSLARPT